MEQADRFLDQPILQIAGTGITLGTLLTAILIFLAALVIAWMVRRLVRRAQKELGEERAPTIYVGGQVVRYIVIIAGVAAAVSALGVDLSAFSLFAGALGVGIGFGLQDVVKNFICGIILLFDRSIEVGDYIELDNGTEGLVTGIGPRATSLRTNDEVDILVPNGDITSGRLTNWTRNRATRRVHVPFRVAYGTDKERVTAAVLDAARALPFTMPDEGGHISQVWLTGFGDSSLNFELVVWPTLEAVKRPGSTLAAYRWAIEDALRAQNIAIPFPQRDVHVRSLAGPDDERWRLVASATDEGQREPLADV